MAHAKSLRVIGQSVESARIVTFELEKYGAQYMLWSEAVTEASERFLRHLLGDSNGASDHASCRSSKRVFVFSPADILRLDAQAQKQRRNQSFAAAPSDKLISHGLRVLGDQLDRLQANAFRIDWMRGSVLVDYQRLDGARNFRTFTFAEIRELDLQPKLRRSSLYLFPGVNS